MKHSEVIAVIGGQWGDEGKGKIVDYLATTADVVIRSQGGDNAGHTVINDHGKFGLHLVPAGIFNPRTLNIIGAGVALNPKTLMKEIAELTQRGVSFDNLVISPKSHLAFEYHRFIDSHQEAARGAKRIDTTKRGIGPTYMDKAERIGLHARMLLYPDRLLAELDDILASKRAKLGVDNEVLHADYYAEFVHEAAATLRPFIRDTEVLVEEHLHKGSRFVLEGAHGTLLDLDHGTYPMVTASNSTAGGLLVGAGMPPLALTKVIGIFKAYQTRVGAGGMPTELHDDLATTIRERGQEFGTTTGRPRRIGYFDGVAARYAHRLNGFTDIALTKVDTLADLGELKIATGYEDAAGAASQFQTEADLLANCHARYQTFPGWTTADLAGVTSYDALPESLKAYCAAITATMPGARLSFVGVGRSREQLIRL
ncbi:MAG TPA: adenylosuccinate synthase [Candidatus Saccharimonadia bacterium]|nr:adenylosuccinate synthase [Candidatus Saccharimonadia bacterium]